MCLYLTNGKNYFIIYIVTIKYLIDIFKGDINMNNNVIILAGGQGKRMKTDKPKVLCNVIGEPMLEWVLTACENAALDNICIVKQIKIIYVFTINTMSNHMFIQVNFYIRKLMCLGIIIIHVLIITIVTIRLLKWKYL